MPDRYQQQFDEDRARQAQRSKQDRDRQTESSQRPVAPPEPASFPWGMFCLAILFDAFGFLCIFLAALVPFLAILPFLSETLAGLIFGLWQWFYNPKTDPIITFIVAKIIDAISLGILPSNIGIVVYAYIKKKAADKIFNAMQTTGGLAMANKMLKNQQI